MDLFQLHVCLDHSLVTRQHWIQRLSLGPWVFLIGSSLEEPKQGLLAKVKVFPFSSTCWWRTLFLFPKLRPLKTLSKPRLYQRSACNLCTTFLNALETCFSGFPVQIKCRDAGFKVRRRRISAEENTLVATTTIFCSTASYMSLMSIGLLIYSLAVKFRKNLVAILTEAPPTHSHMSPPTIAGKVMWLARIVKQKQI